MTEKPRPNSIFFFSEGQVAVCDQFGHQMPRYQSGNHLESIVVLRLDGYRWEDIPEIHGVPFIRLPGQDCPILGLELLV